MRILITGATGFIGSYLVNNLSNQGHCVIGFSRKNPDLKTKVAEWITGDVLDTELPTRKIEADVIVHLASANDIVSGHVRSALDLSVFGTKNVLDWAVNNGVHRFVFFSTFQVYGHSLSGCIDEQTPVSLENDYAMNHYLAEKYVEMYAERGRLAAAIVRPANVYGPISSNTVDRWTLVPACFCLEAYQHRTITLRSSGKQLRNFVSLNQVHQQLNCLLSRFPESFDTYNICAPSGTLSIRSVAERVQTACERLFDERPVLIVQSGEPSCVQPFDISIEKLKLLGYGGDHQPSQHGLDSAIKSILDNLKATRND